MVPVNSDYHTRKYFSENYQQFSLAPSQMSPNTVLGLKVLKTLFHEKRLRRSASSVAFHYIMKTDKTCTTQSRDISHPSYANLNPLLSITPVHCQSKLKAVRTYGSNSVPLLSYCLRKRLSLR